MTLSDTEGMQAYFSFENPRFPALMTSQLAHNLLVDLVAAENRAGGKLTLTEGFGVYGGLAEKCYCVSFSIEYDDDVATALFFLLQQLTRWTGQESALIVRRPRHLEALPIEVGLSFTDYPDACVGNLIHSQTSEEIGSTMLWRQAERDEIYIDGVPKDHTFIGGNYYLLTTGA